MTNELKILSQNLRSLASAFDALEIGQNKENYDIILGQEVWAPKIQYDLHNFHPLITNLRTNKRGGGVGIYIKNYINFTLRQDLTVFNECEFESLIIEISSKKGNIIIGNFYRPPQGNITNFTTIIKNLIKSCKLENKRYYIFGDANINYISTDSSTERLKRELINLDSKQIVNNITRIGKNATIIDHCYSDISELTECKTVEHSISDHLGISCIINIDYNKIKIKPSGKQHTYNYCKENIDILSEKLNQIQWATTFENLDANSMVKSLENTISNLVNLHCKKTNKEHTHSIPWFNTRIFNQKKLTNNALNKWKQKQGQIGLKLRQT